MANLFAESELKYHYGSSTSHDDPKLRGNPDHSLFSRHEKHEVLYLINHILKTHATLAENPRGNGAKIEELIHGMPSNLHSQAHVHEYVLRHLDAINA